MWSQAIELSQETLAGVKFIKEKKLILKFFDEISQDSGKFSFGVDDTIKVRTPKNKIWERKLEMGHSNF